MHESLEDNIGLLFEAEKKLKKKIAGAKAAMEKPVVSRAKRAATAPVMKKRYYPDGEGAVTEDAAPAAAEPELWE